MRLDLVARDKAEIFGASFQKRNAEAVWRSLGDGVCNLRDETIFGDHSVLEVGRRQEDHLFQIVTLDFLEDREDIDRIGAQKGTALQEDEVIRY